MNQIDQRVTHDHGAIASPRVHRECERNKRAWYARRKNLFLLPRSRALGRVPVKTMFIVGLLAERMMPSLRTFCIYPFPSSNYIIAAWNQLAQEARS